MMNSDDDERILQLIRANVWVHTSFHKKFCYLLSQMFTIASKFVTSLCLLSRSSVSNISISAMKLTVATC